MRKVSELLPREQKPRTIDVVVDGDVRVVDDFRDADGEIIDIPYYEPEPPAPSARDLRIAELERQRDAYDEFLDKEVDKLGWSLSRVIEKHGKFPGAAELQKLTAERDREIIQIGAAAAQAVLRFKKQLAIDKIADPVERAAAQKAFDLKEQVKAEKKNRPHWDR